MDGVAAVHDQRSSHDGAACWAREKCHGFGDLRRLDQAPDQLLALLVEVTGVGVVAHRQAGPTGDEERCLQAPAIGQERQRESCDPPLPRGTALCRSPIGRPRRRRPNAESTKRLPAGAAAAANAPRQASAAPAPTALEASAEGETNAAIPAQAPTITGGSPIRSASRPAGNDPRTRPQLMHATSSPTPATDSSKLCFRNGTRVGTPISTTDTLACARTAVATSSPTRCCATGAGRSRAARTGWADAPHPHVTGGSSAAWSQSAMRPPVTNSACSCAANSSKRARQIADLVWDARQVGMQRQRPRSWTVL